MQFLLWLFVAVCVFVLSIIVIALIYGQVTNYKIRKKSNDSESIRKKSSDLKSESIRKISSDLKKEKTHIIPDEELDDDKYINAVVRSKDYIIPESYYLYDYMTAQFNNVLNKLNKIEVRIEQSDVARVSGAFPISSYRNITSRTNLNLLSNFISIDVETTGLRKQSDDIIEVSAIKFEDFYPVELYTTLVKPRKPIPESATSINGITNDMVENAPKFSEIHNSLVEFLGKYPLVAHNAAFDMKFLYASGLKIDYEKRIIFDTLELSRRTIKDDFGKPLENYKLGTVCSEENIFFNKAHRASSDALAAGLLFITIVKNRKGVEDLVGDNH